jgi:peptidoglycan/LPS O-acetylase OafA/YrhL
VHQRLEDLSTQSVKRFYFPQIDGLRFIAFALVLMHHLPHADLLDKIGWVGVDIFWCCQAS